MRLAPQILALTLGHVFSNAVRTVPAISADVMSRDLGLGTDTLAAITGAFPAAFALAMVPVGVALDRYGSKRTILVLLAVCVAGCMLALTAGGPLGMLGAQAVLGVGCAGMLMAPMTFAGRLLSPAAFGLWSGIIQATGNSGMLLSASPLAWLVEAQGWRAGYLACAALAVFAVAAIAALVREPPPAGPPRAVLADMRAVLAFTTVPRLLPCMVLASASFGAVLGVRGLWGGPWLMEVKGLDRLATGDLLLLSAASLVAGPFLAGVVARLWGRLVPIVAAGHLLAAACILGLVLAAPVRAAWLDAALLVAFGITISAQVMLFALVRSRVTPEVTGRALSAMNIFFFGGAAVLQAASGVAAAWGGVGSALLTFAVALVAATGAFLWLERRLRPR